MNLFPKRHFSAGHLLTRAVQGVTLPPLRRNKAKQRRPSCEERRCLDPSEIYKVAVVSCSMSMPPGRRAEAGKPALFRPSELVSETVKLG